MSRYKSRSYGKNVKVKQKSFSVGGSYSEGHDPNRESAIMTGMLTGLGAYISVEIFKFAVAAGKEALANADRSWEIDQVSTGRSSYPR